MISDLRKPGGEELQAQILFVAQSVGSSLKDPDLIVHVFNGPKGDLVFRVAIGGNPFPMALNHLRKFFVRLQALPLPGRAPVLKEAACPAFLLIVPQLAERLLEQVGGLQPLGGAQQYLESTAAFESRIFPPRQQRILLFFDALAVFAPPVGVLVLAYLVQGLIEVAQNMKFVEQKLGLRGMRSVERRGAKGLPHIHHRQAKALALLGSQPRGEHIHALLRSILPTEPEYPPPRQVADGDAVGMPLANRNLVDADAFGPRSARSAQLLLHVLFVQLLDRLPVQMQLPGHIAQGSRTTPPPNKEGEAFGIEGVVGQPGRLLLLHRSTATPLHAPDLDLQVDPRVATREVAHPTYLVVVERPRRRATDAAASFFPRRTSHRTRALGSPKTSPTVALERNPGKRYVSTSRRDGRIGKACHVFSRRKTPQCLIQSHFPHPPFFPTRLGEDPKKGELMKTILLADDELSLRVLVRTTLADPAYRILEAADGVNALELVRAERPDLLVLDWMMPGLSGIAVATALRQDPATAAIPIIMLTAKGQDADRGQGQALGLQAYLVKPFSPLELLDKVQEILGEL